MHTLIKATGILNGINQRWHILNPLTYSVKQLYQIYRKIYLEVSDDIHETNHYVDLWDLANEYSEYTGNLIDLLVSIGNTTIPYVTNVPDINTRTIRYKDAYRAGYQLTPIDPLYGTNSAPEYRTAIRITRDNPVTDYDLFYQHCLVSVNGFFHLTDTDGTNGIVVYHANTSRKIANQNQVGIISFYNVAGLEFIPITEDMIYKNDPLQPISESGYIKIGRDLTNKSVLISIGGYLHYVDGNLIQFVNDDEITIDFSNYNLFERYYESKHYIDLSSLPMSQNSVNDSQIATEELLSDNVLKKYLTLPQSFVIVVDAPQLFFNKQYIKKTNLPGMVISHQEPKYPLVAGLGRFPEYWSTKEDGQYSLTLYDNTKRNYIFNTTETIGLPSIGDSQLPIDPESVEGLYFLEIGRDI